MTRNIGGLLFALALAGGAAHTADAAVSPPPVARAASSGQVATPVGFRRAHAAVVWAPAPAWRVQRRAIILRGHVTVRRHLR